MSFLMPKAPALPPPPKPVTRADPRIRDALQQRPTVGSRRASILTSPFGAADSADNVRRAGLGQPV